MKKETQALLTCPCCNKGKLEPTVMDYRITVQDGIEITIPQLAVEICDQCGEVALPADSTVRVDEAVAAQNEQLTPRELENIRENMELDQTQMSDLLGLGGKTYHRWENGIQVPSRSMGYYLRILAEFQEAADWLRERGWRKKNRIRKQLNLPFAESFPDLARKNPGFERTYTGLQNRRINPARIFEHTDTK
ncbi:MAG: type II toxin-antitoxin system MqsA family antitoxin [Methylacidiphilales bacterium]|nr:type II toxin-antitoxin system MqsA family antitoxin [Candidatus Methylacidiphilales bacterium]